MKFNETLKKIQRNKSCFYGEIMYNKKRNEIEIVSTGSETYEIACENYKNDCATLESHEILVNHARNYYPYNFSHSYLIKVL